jgi:CHAT domain
VLAEVAALVNRTPTVLIVSAENLIPWELTRVDPPLYPMRPAFLGAQVILGRWALSQGTAPRPKMKLSVKQIAAIAGCYNTTSGFEPLPRATDERDALIARYQAVSVAASDQAIAKLLDAEVPGEVQVVHFAGHGDANPLRPAGTAIFLDDGSALTPTMLLAAPLAKRYEPFLFLNACLVGNAGEVLGDFAGFPGDAITGGFRAFLAPLWAVDDTVAHEIALELYDRTIGPSARGESVGAILRDIRWRYDPKQRPASTYLSYVFYGHPSLMLSR